MPGERELAYLTWRLVGHTEDGDKIMEVGVIGHSDVGADLSTRVAEEVRAWSENHRNRTVQFEIPTAGAAFLDPAEGRFVLDRPHNSITVV